MRIKNATAFPLKYPEPHDSGKPRSIVIVRVESSGDVEGWGECICHSPEASLAVALLIEQSFAGLIEGRDPREVSRIWEDLHQHAFWFGYGGIADLAIAAIDMALWDLKGKAAGLPVYDLLGGRMVDRMRACASVIFDMDDLEATYAEFSEYASRGFTAVKGGWGKSRETAFGLDSDRDLEIVRVVRDAVGPKVDVIVDVGTHVKWSLSHAQRMFARLEEFGLLWIEEPLPRDELQGLRELRRSTRTAIATGEKEWNLRAFADLIATRGVDIVMPDAGKMGITGFKKVIDLASVHGIGFTPHSWSSAINTAAAAHLFASSTNGVVFELKPHPSPMHDELVSTPMHQVQGWVYVDDEPGLGVQIRETTLDKYLIR